MTTFGRFCGYVDAGRKMVRPPRGAPYSEVVTALADAGFLGATAGELLGLAKHMRGFVSIRQERSALLSEAIDLMRKYGVTDPDFGSSAALGRAVPRDDMRGQTVIHDLRQFEDDLTESARRLQKKVPELPDYDADETANNVFAWVYALQSGMLK
jgi:hypothetical protein